MLAGILLPYLLVMVNFKDFKNHRSTTSGRQARQEAAH